MIESAIRRHSVPFMFTGAAALVGVLFALPLIDVLLTRADYVGFAGESLAYRYFASARIFAGEGSRIWLPQGHLTSVLQHVIYFFIDGVFQIPWGDFKTRFNAFGLSYSVVVVILNAAVLLIAARLPALNASDRWLIFFTALTPIFATRTAGFYYSTLPDYYHLNMVIITASVLLFLLNLRSPLEAFTNRRAIVVGTFVGLALSNKVSMLPIAASILMPILVQLPGGSLGLMVRRGTVVTLAALAAVTTVFLSFHLYDLGAILPALKNIVAKARNPGAEPAFWENLGLFLFDYSYVYVIGLLVIVLVLTSLTNAVYIHRIRGIHRIGGLTLLHGTILFLALVYAYFIAHRPAGTTFFESTNAMIGLIAMSLALVRDDQSRRWFSGAVVLMVAVFSAATFNHGHNYNSLLNRTAEAGQGWVIFNIAQSIGRPVIVILPDNDYAWGNPEQVLIKGLSEYPSWEITTGQRYLDQLAAPITFRTEQGGRKPAEPYPDDATIIWYDRLDLTPLPDRYPSLATAIRDRNCERWNIHSAIATTLCRPRGK